MSKTTVLLSYSVELVGPQAFNYMTAVSIAESWKEKMREVEENQIGRAHV